MENSSESESKEKSQIEVRKKIKGTCYLWILFSEVKESICVNFSFFREKDEYKKKNRKHL